MIILIMTVLAMVHFLPCRYDDTAVLHINKLWKSIIAALVFVVMLIVINEILLPVMGFSNMADGLDVSDDNKLFFYIIMFAGFWIGALLVAYMDFKAQKSGSRRFIWAYISLIWCVFDLTMIPLGYGIISTLLFICASIISMSLEYLVLHKL